MPTASNITRAVALLQVKGLQEGASRKFRGVATTPETDRMGDTIDPLGAMFKNPIVLLHQHRHDAPIGVATFGRPTSRGIPFTAEIPTIEEPGLLKDRTDLAWHEIKSGLVRAVSIGFIPDHDHTVRNDSGGLHFGRIEIIELSTVSVPANAGATIEEVKALDAQARAAAEANGGRRRRKAAVRGPRRRKADAQDPRAPGAFEEAQKLLSETIEETWALFRELVDATPADKHKEVQYTQATHDAFKSLAARHRLYTRVHVRLLIARADETDARLAAIEAKMRALP